MAIGYSKAGRPRGVAEIDFSSDSELAFWDNFSKACSNLRYAEIMALSRAFGINPKTVEKWKYGLQFPRKEQTAHKVIDWVHRGKPIRYMLTTQSDMLQ